MLQALRAPQRYDCERLRHERGPAASCAAWRRRLAWAVRGRAGPVEVLGALGHHLLPPELHAADTPHKRNMTNSCISTSVLSGVAAEILLVGIIAFRVFIFLVILTPAGADAILPIQLLKQFGPQCPIQPLGPIP